MTLSSRLAAAARLYTPCRLGADIGTDHALLPCFLLEAGICRQMLLCDISPKALSHARAEVSRRHLEERAELICAPGLSALEGRTCGCVSITGMGGDTMAGILREGAGRLRGAALVLSPQTHLPLVRQTAADIGYRPEQETLCLDGGRYYQVWRLVPGVWQIGEEERRYGRLLYRQNPELIRGYLTHRLRVYQSWLEGLRSAEEQDGDALARTEEDYAFTLGMLQSLKGV